jgi:hypothetical protein
MVVSFIANSNKMMKKMIETYELGQLIFKCKKWIYWKKHTRDITARSPWASRPQPYASFTDNGFFSNQFLMHEDGKHP